MFVKAESNGTYFVKTFNEAFEICITNPLRIVKSFNTFFDKYPEVER